MRPIPIFHGTHGHGLQRHFSPAGGQYVKTWSALDLGFLDLIVPSSVYTASSRVMEAINMRCIDSVSTYSPFYLNNDSVSHAMS